MLNPYKIGSQKERILTYLQLHSRLEVWMLITPQPKGLGVAQYNARIKEIRDNLPDNYKIINKAGKYFELVRIDEQPTLI